jgi:hypothetical protein
MEAGRHHYERICPAAKPIGRPILAAGFPSADGRPWPSRAHLDAMLSAVFACQRCSPVSWRQWCTSARVCGSCVRPARSRQPSAGPTRWPRSPRPSDSWSRATEVARSSSPCERPLVLQDIAAPTLARDLGDLRLAQRSGAYSPRLPGVTMGPSHRAAHGPLGGVERPRRKERFAHLIERRGRAFGRTCGPRRLRRHSQPAVAATQGGALGPPMTLGGPRAQRGSTPWVPRSETCSVHCWPSQ